ncbi:MAG: PQQ-binding-like beta-propeller repeat protein [Acidobacteria bacterium]|nr:PQQ-binding-like beta-propeller repeat protein [Acidobacteriota bacterium]
MHTRLRFLVIAGATVLTVAGLAQTVNDAGRNWSHPQGDAGGTRFSTLTQINATNVNRLRRAWTFRTGSGRFANSPMVVDSVMYFSAPNGVYALDAVTGQQIWKYAPAGDAAPDLAAAARGAGAAGRGANAGEEADGAPPAGRAGGGGGRGGAPNVAGTAVRGPAYWPGATGVAPRIFSSTIDGLAALDAKTGTLVTTFGEKGVLPTIRHNSPPALYRNLIITRGENEPGKGNTVKAFDAVTGQHRWTFYAKAQPGDPNRGTWLNGSAESDATPGMWGMFTVDEARGLVFFPVEKVEGNGANDYWGGGNHGNGLYSDSLVALDANTGRMKWFQQVVHHDIWDYDLAAAPVLVDVRRNGQVIPAVAQSSKMALMFIFNRETGEPVFGVEERPVPQTTVPGEWTSPTQPFPVKPEPLSRNSFKQTELAKVTPEHQAFCQNLWDTNKLTDTVPYNPWKVGANTLVFPGAQGGSNWWGVTFNRPLGLIIGNVHNSGQWGQLVAGGGGRRGGGAGAAAPAAGAAAAPGRGGGGPQGFTKTPGPFTRFWNNANMWSCTEPPWGELVAVNANTGDIAWRVPLGEFEELTKRGVKPTGTPNSGGAITTAGNLVFIGATIAGYFRAFDARNGRELWRDKLPVPSQGTPTTYMGRDGKQYVVVGANGGGFFGAPTGDEVIAYALP